MNSGRSELADKLRCRKHWPLEAEAGEDGTRAGAHEAEPGDEEEADFPNGNASLGYRTLLC